MPVMENIQTHYWKLSALCIIQMQKNKKYRGEKSHHNKEQKKESPWPVNSLIRTENMDQQEDENIEGVLRNNATFK